MKPPPVTCLQTEDEKVVRIRKLGVQPESNTQVWACLSRLVNYKDGSQLCNDAVAGTSCIVHHTATSAHSMAS